METWDPILTKNVELKCLMKFISFIFHLVLPANMADRIHLSGPCDIQGCTLNTVYSLVDLIVI